MRGVALGLIITIMSNKLPWGVLSTADIGLQKVIPAMQQGQYTRVDAIASRSLAKAQHAAMEASSTKGISTCVPRAAPTAARRR